MRPLFLSILLVAALAVPVAASADTPPPAVVAACQAEYQQLGKDAFVAKYGPTEPFGHCYEQHAAPAPPPPSTTTTDNPALAACKAEYLQLGPDAFGAKYGKTETFGSCVKAHGGAQPTQTTPPARQNGEDGASSVATAFCQSQMKALGRDAFSVTYGGKEAMGSCLKAALTSARALVASCKASSGASTTALKACIAAGLSAKRR